MIPGDAPELERAIAAARKISVLGSVANFDGFLSILTEVLKGPFPDFTAQSVQANVSKPAKKAETNDQALTELLEKANRDDITLVKTLFG